MDGGVSKIAFIDENSISPTVLLASVAEREDLEGVVVVAKCDGCWAVCWSKGVMLSGLSMAAVKLLADVQAQIHGLPFERWTPDKSA